MRKIPNALFPPNPSIDLNISLCLLYLRFIYQLLVFVLDLFVIYLFIYIPSLFNILQTLIQKRRLSDSELPLVEVQLSSYEVKSGDVPVSVRGRLHKSIQFWREIDVPCFIVDTIEFGYKLPLLQIPPPFVAMNNNSALQESEFVKSAISKPLSLECIAEVFAPPAVIYPLSVSIQ